MANKDLFKQAIAEAKSVREAAIANAKEALEETLTPHLKDMLAAKLQEMEDKDIKEEEVVNEEEVEEGMEKDNKDEAIEETFTEEEDVIDAEDDADVDSEESEEEAEEEVEVKDMEVDDLKDLIRDIIAQEMGHDHEEEVPGEELPADDMVGAEDEEEIDLDELLREITEMSDEKNDESVEEEVTGEMSEEGIEEVIDPVTVGAGVAALFGGAAGLSHLMDKLKAGEFGDRGKKLAQGLEKAGSAAASVTQHRNESEISEEEIEEVRPGYGVGEFGDPKDNELVKAVMFLAKHAKKAGKKVGDFVKDIELGKMSDAMKEVELEESSDIEEATATIEQLKGQLQEVNLLNAKLLYVNKVFKANNLTESQKVNVIAAFDKAETVKEVKLVFETVSDNVVGKTTKGSIKEAKLGMASKATGTTASKPEVISEVSDAVKRMQKLAGIIK
jgi:hypothetical protein